MKTKLTMLLTGLSLLICHSVSAKDQKAVVENTCTGTWPAYWQDVDPKFSEMWSGQTVSNAPTADWTQPVFKLSDKYPTMPVDDKAHQKWRDKKFDALFNPSTSQKDKTKLASEYAWLVMKYVQEGNINQPKQLDFDVCENPVRPWYHIPFQTYDAMSGREFTHGLTREAPVTFSTIKGTGTDKSTMWAVAIYNATAAYTLGTIWQKEGTVNIPKTNLHFDEGAVIAKPLFNTSTVDQLPILANMPAWNANISDPSFCECKPSAGSECTLVEESQQCPRSYAQWGDVRLMQFDIAIKDSRAPKTGWVYGTFVADGVKKAKEKEPWKRISLLGLMWGNDTPPKGQLAYNNPTDPRKNGFMEEVIIWDTVERLNAYSGSAQMRQMGHLGCNFRLNGPADNANSSCMSCHGTASVPDKNFETPPMISQFSGQTKECVAALLNNMSLGMDRAGDPATVNNGISFSDIDGLYFTNVGAGQSFNMTVQTPSGPKNVMANDAPNYSNGQKQWISLDYSLQSSIALKQWMQWQMHQTTKQQLRIVDKELRRN
ncbi:hypothetical protein ORJ66_06345 [Pseudoalteromonas tunicata]|uniref:hypothetical protein n=1 Tax=Pseudoalteromonas tunicata TaxID=314281 RepID=UPI0027402475|nr:hypothetical protein [Pseudoalteromonas tunicata]MDP5212660.1 hypothetical protein [Pseudoalteromonas tunicata]